MLFIHVDKKDGTGGFLISDTEEDRELIQELLKDGEYVLRAKDGDVKGVKHD